MVGEGAGLVLTLLVPKARTLVVIQVGDVTSMLNLNLVTLVPL